MQTEVGTSILTLGLLLPSVRAILECLADPEGFVEVQARESDVNREFPHVWQQSPQYERLWPPSANDRPLCAPQRWIFPALAAVSAHPLRQLLWPAVSDQRQLLDRLSCEHANWNHFESRPAQRSRPGQKASPIVYQKLLASVHWRQLLLPPFAAHLRLRPLQSRAAVR